jgi:hypothetical protein
VSNSLVRRFEFSADAEQRLQALMDRCGTNDSAEVLRKALRLFEWAVEEVENGRRIYALDESNKGSRIDIREASATAAPLGRHRGPGWIQFYCERTQAMQKRPFVSYAFIPLLALSGCAEAGKLASADLTNAAQVANQSGDSQGAACWVALAPAANAIETAPKPGLASVIEADRLFASATQGPNAPCNAVGGMILSMVLRKAVPFLP